MTGIHNRGIGYGPGYAAGLIVGRDANWQLLTYNNLDASLFMPGGTFGTCVLFTADGPVTVRQFSVQNGDTGLIGVNGWVAIALGIVGTTGLFLASTSIDQTELFFTSDQWDMALSPVTESDISADIVATTVPDAGEATDIAGTVDIAILWQPQVAGSGATLVKTI